MQIWVALLILWGSIVHAEEILSMKCVLRDLATAQDLLVVEHKPFHANDSFTMNLDMENLGIVARVSDTYLGKGKGQRQHELEIDNGAVDGRHIAWKTYNYADLSQKDFVFPKVYSELIEMGDLMRLSCEISK